MRGSIQPVQWRHSVFHTRDAEEASVFLRAEEFQLNIPAREAQHTDTRINGVSLPGMYLGYLQYGAAAEIRANSSRDDYRLLCPSYGHLQAVTRKEEVASGPGKAILNSPGLTKLVRSERDSAWLNIFLRGPVLRRHLAALLGEQLKVPLEFAPTLSVREGYGASITHYARSAMTDLDRAAPLMNPIAAGLFEQFLMVGLLLAHPHNYSEALSRGRGPIAPRDIRRAVDYIHANLDMPITLTDIVAASGIAGRTLSQHFRRFRGTTPMRYLRDARLDKVREALRRAEPQEGVTSIAMNWGFSHIGRFSAQYRRRFGETPSQTLAKRPLSTRRRDRS